MNFSAIPETSFLGKVLRLPLRLLPANMRVRILQGRLRGKKWIVGAGTHGYWLGSFEYEKQSAFEQVVVQGNTVFDIGAHVGLYTILSSILVGPKGFVYAFEPLPRNLMYLEKHLQLNHIQNIKVVEAAVADYTGMASFDVGSHNSMGSLKSDGKLQVQTVCLDELIGRGELPVPDVIKIDVEGAELKVLNGSISVLSARHPTLVLATHGRDIHRQCIDFLRNLNYQVFAIKGDNVHNTDELLVQYP